MKNILGISFLAGLLLLVSAPVARSYQSPASSPPVEQALVREGDLAVQLAAELRLGAAGNEVAAESSLTAVGIAPRNGWVADYPVTPIVFGDLQNAVSAAADAGKLTMSRDQAVAALQRVASDDGLPIRPGNGNYSDNQPIDPNRYTDPSAVNDYYYEDGPPVVTYYSPPVDYYDLYDWVSYPFWYGGYGFSGFFVLNDFDRIHHSHFGGRDDYKLVSNHVFDKGTDRYARIDPVTGDRTTPARADPGVTRLGRHGSGGGMSAGFTYGRDAQRFGAVSGNRRSGMNAGSGGGPRFSGNPRSDWAASSGSAERFSGSRSFNSGGAFASSGFSHGGGFSHSSGFGGFGHSGGFGGFAHGGGFGGGGGFHGGGGGRR